MEVRVDDAAVVAARDVDEARAPVGRGEGIDPAEDGGVAGGVVGIDGDHVVVVALSAGAGIEIVDEAAGGAWPRYGNGCPRAPAVGRLLHINEAVRRAVRGGQVGDPAGRDTQADP